MAATIRLVEPLLGFKRVDRVVRRWIKDGAAYCILAASGAFCYMGLQNSILISYVGSIYLLAILACAQVRTAISGMSTCQIIRLGALLRCPPLSKCFVRQSYIHLYLKI